jgi:hypothetical protein
MAQLETLTLLEQALAAELSYYRQSEQISATIEDWATWEQGERLRVVVEELTGKMSASYQPEAFAHHLLERHGYSLHRYMAQQLSPEAWACWFAQGGLLSPFHRVQQKSESGPL